MTNLDRQSSDPLPRDLDRADTTAWPQRIYPLVRDEARGVPVVVRQSVLNEIHCHGRSTTDVEVCGVLVGNGYCDEHGPFVYVEASIRGEHAGNQLAQVTFTAETWQHIQAELDQDYPDLRIVGWYHTHPGFGIFLSPMDLFIHENFFNGPEQVALVYDPIRLEEGMFVWRAGEVRRERVKVELDVAEQDDKMTMKITSFPEAIAAAGDADLLNRLRRLDNQQRWLWIVLLFTVILAVAWPVTLDIWHRPKLPPPPLFEPSSIHTQPNSDLDLPSEIHGVTPPLSPDSQTESQAKISIQPSDPFPANDGSKKKP